MRIDYLGLVAFVSIADHGSFQRAAESLNLSQAALSHRLRKIEEDLGAPLLARSSREVSLTSTGQGLLPEARRLLSELHGVYESVRAGSQRQRARLTFACLPSVANSVLPEAVAAYGAANPDIAVEIHDIPVAQISERVRSGAAEFGVTIMSVELSDLRLRPLGEEEYRLIVPRSHPLAAAGEVRRSDLVGMRMARISSHSKNRQLVDVGLGEYRDQMIWQYEVQSAATALRIVAEGAALTILPSSAIRLAPPGLVTVPFVDTWLGRTLGIVTRRGVPLTTRATRMMTEIEKCVARLSDPDLHVSSPGPRD
ncbi:transcriptional regulator [Roseivivax marinus]|jgi:DNA-binding transcriptional LysR family regulator|uniref:Transcriptional regulator n=1 Tax=Roseivivax marinus TaxID=1379903 RepID=W4HFI9_9RHOB|nr:LysR substrate-binding domain-containing protein [Roseivivax marinus]ETW11527.1 transcriptional regulator [Roseivivax marinus]UMA67170.1 LysR substrate-binding domain-containing protein [Roseivivax marinus]